MKILDRTLAQRTAKIAVFALLLFTLAWLAPETMFRAVQGVSEGTFTVGQGLAFLVYQIPEVLGYCIPIAGLMASVFLFRQLSMSSELTAILASGIAFKRLLLPVGAVGLVLSLLFFATQEWLTPWATENLHDLNKQTHYQEEKLAPAHVTFVEKKQDGSLGKFLLISPDETASDNRFLFLFYTGSGNQTRMSQMITASRGQWIPKVNSWKLSKGIIYTLSPEGVYQEVIPFEEYLVSTSPVANALLDFPTGNPRMFHMKQLERYARLLDKGGQTEDARFYRVRLFQRYVLVWIPLVFALLGTAIGVERSRARRNLGLTYAAILLLLYNIMVPVSASLGNIGILPEFVAALLPLALSCLAGLGIIRLRRAEA